MKKVTGFLDYERLPESYEPAEARIAHSREFVRVLTTDEARRQAVRCMDCGIPFCSNGCPVNNIIPDFNDLVLNDRWAEAIERLHETNNFPEFTGRVCPAPCEAACTLNLNREAVGIKSIERAIIDHAWENGLVQPQVPTTKTGKKIAVVGSGPAGMACAQQLARAGHEVTVFEKNAEVGGLLRFGIPDFKLEKDLVDRRVEQMQAEGVTFRTGVAIGSKASMSGLVSMAETYVSADELKESFDAVVLAAGSEIPRDLPVPGRELAGVHFAMEYLVQHNRRVKGFEDPQPILAKGKHVVVIGGGDTGSDCVGTANRQGAASVTQFELLGTPPESEDKMLTWPNWPIKLRTSSSHEEGCVRDWGVQTKALRGQGKVETLDGVRVQFQEGKFVEIPGSAFSIPADLVLLAMGFTNPADKLLAEFGIEKDRRGNALADTTRFQTSDPKVYAAGDVRRGQSLVVWAIREGRDCAASLDAALRKGI